MFNFLWGLLIGLSVIVIIGAMLMIYTLGVETKKWKQLKEKGVCPACGYKMGVNDDR